VCSEGRRDCSVSVMRGLVSHTTSAYANVFSEGRRDCSVSVIRGLVSHTTSAYANACAQKVGEIVVFQLYEI
jgi:hypothetical protein